MSKRKTYLQNAALLTGSGLVLRALGMGFRVVLAAYLGGEGMGLYQLILALYMVFVSFATAGINVASARLAAQSLARGSGMAETLRGLCFTALGFGTTAMVAQAVLAGPCARYLLHDIRAETALLILAPSLPFMAVSGAVRGCFLAARRVQPNITAQFIEQLVRMAVAVAGLRALAQWGAGYGCAAVLLGNTVSEGVSCGVMLAFAARTPEFVPRPGAPLHPYTRRELYDILWPVEGSRLLASALQAAESSLIPYTLALCTGSRTEAVAQYGSLKGMALPLLFFPFSVLGALSGLLMPEITRAHTKGDTAAMRRLIFTMLRLTGAFSLAAGAGFVVFGAPLAQFVYRIKPVRAFFFHCMQPVRQLVHLLTFFAYADFYLLQLTAQFHEPSRKARNHAPVFLYRRCKRLFFLCKPVVLVFQRGGLLFAPRQRYAALRFALGTFG